MASMKKGSKLRQAENKELEDLFAFQLQINGMLKYFAREVLFIEGRRFRLDFGDPINKIGVEIQGAIWSPNTRGHNSGAGIARDQEKLNLGHLNGWRVFQFNVKSIKDLSAIDLLRRYYIQVLKVDLPAAGRAH